MTVQADAITLQSAAAGWNDIADRVSSAHTRLISMSPGPASAAADAVATFTAAWDPILAQITGQAEDAAVALAQTWVGLSSSDEQLADLLPAQGGAQ